VSVSVFLEEEGVDFFLGLDNNFFDLFCAVVGVVPEGGTDGASDN
jgi:hypothetical protein